MERNTKREELTVRRFPKAIDRIENRILPTSKNRYKSAKFQDTKNHQTLPNTNPNVQKQPHVVWATNPQKADMKKPESCE
jgi:hypothetical protein